MFEHFSTLCMKGLTGNVSKTKFLTKNLSWLIEYQCEYQIFYMYQFREEKEKLLICKSHKRVSHIFTGVLKRNIGLKWVNHLC